MRQAFGKEAKIEKHEIAQMLVVVAPDRRRHLVAGLRKRIEQILHAAAGFIPNTVHVVDLDKIRQQIRDVSNCLRIREVELTHTALGQLLKEGPERMILGNVIPCFFDHAPFPLLT